MELDLHPYRITLSIGSNLCSADSKIGSYGYSYSYDKDFYEPRSYFPSPDELSV